MFPGSQTNPKLGRLLSGKSCGALSFDLTVQKMPNDWGSGQLRLQIPPKRRAPWPLPPHPIEGSWNLPQVEILIVFRDKFT